MAPDEFALLEAIRESGSLSQAAARLGKAPSTVAHAARQLEARFDALLFDRRRYRLQLTPAGQRARVASLLERRELIAKQVADPREPNTLYVGWRGDREGRGLQWWVEQLKQKRLARVLDAALLSLIRRVDASAGTPTIDSIASG